MQLSQDFISRAKRSLNLNDYGQISQPIKIKECLPQLSSDRQYVLRMMVRNPESNGFKIPEALNWLSDTILELDSIQKQNNLLNPFVYVTVRHGLVESKTDDVWHVDGFSMRIKHLLEQNYIWSDRDATEYADQAFPLPETFDPMKHHLHWYFEDHVEKKNIKQLQEKTIYAIDPYLVHRRPKSTANTNEGFLESLICSN